MSNHHPKVKKNVKRYTTADRILHWAVALGFVLALVSGYLIFFQGTSTLLDNAAGMVLRVAHRVGAILFVVAPILYFIFNKKRFGFLQAFKYDKSDLGWLKAAPKHYFLGGDLPPQGKYNTGQKVYYLFAVVVGFLLAFTGFAMWFNLFDGRLGMLMIVLHDLGALALGLFFVIHVYLAAIHPRENISLNAMVTGYMDREYAEHGHELWFKEMVELEKLEEEKKKLEKQNTQDEKNV